jgi:hypothetical protein
MNAYFANILPKDLEDLISDEQWALNLDAARINAPPPPKRAKVSPEGFTLEVRAVNGKVIRFKFAKAPITVGEVRSVYAKSQHLPEQKLTILFAGHCLPDAAKLSVFDIKSGAVLHVRVDMQGC